MTESEFNQLADETLLRIEEALDQVDVDIDYSNAGGVLTLVFENGSQIIINRQTPARQIWVAAKSGGFHYDYRQETGTWHLSTDEEELFSMLGRLCAEQAGARVDLGAAS